VVATANDLINLHRVITTIRRFEERVTREFKRGDIPGFVHTSVGAEAVAAGVCAHLGDRDYIASTHRGHGHCIAKGCEIKLMLAELYGRDTGLCRGRGGSMHIADFERGMLGANAIVGGGIALAAGGALASKMRGEGGVAVSFFGDGAANQGVLYETMNLASIWQLPVLFVCENNGWAESTPGSYAHSVPDLAVRAAGFAMPGCTVDAGDAEAVFVAAGRAITQARLGGGPSFIEAKVPRMVGHYLGDPEGYRSTGDREAAVARDPLTRLRERLLEANALDAGAIAELEAQIKAILDDGVTFAKAQPWPKPTAVTDFVYSDVELG
jgi:pyruvate dehydrogenase E1 component alpha subunit